MIPVAAVTAAVLERYTLAKLAEPIRLSLTLDEEWSPRVQGELTVSDTADLSGGALWKEQGDTLTVQIAKSYGEPLPIAVLTAAYAGTVAAVTLQHAGRAGLLTRAHTTPWNLFELLQPLTAATVLWGGAVAAVTAEHGGQLARLTETLREPGGSYLIPATERLTMRLVVRSSTPRRAAGTVTYTLASCEVRLHDYRRTDSSVWVSPYTSLRDLVTHVLTVYNEGVNPLDALGLHHSGDTVITAGQEWKPGQTAFELLHPILEAAGWQLYALADGMLRLEPRATVTAPAPLDQYVNLIDYEPTMNAAEAYTGAVVEYTGEDPGPARYDISLMPGAKRIGHESRPGVRAGGGAASQLVTRALQRARAGQAVATLQPRLEPGQRVPIRLGWTEAHGEPFRVTDYGTIRSLTHTYPTNESRIALRDLTE